MQLGEFWMAFVDFITNFTHLECVHLDSDTSVSKLKFEKVYEIFT
jgi:hypothetical protein